MTNADLAARVSWTGGLTVAAMTAGAWWLAGVPAAAGVAGGGAIALVNFRWLARDVSRATALVVGGQAAAGRISRIGLRQLVTFGALGLLVAQGWAHPVGVGVGLAALPPVLLAAGLLGARKEA
ncbi:MAG: ATP synthase subunit I [Anaerolineales bacterium]